MVGQGVLMGIALGLGLGARHALEPDHLAAVSVLAADRPGARRGLLIGALWGAGHTLSLLACGLAVAIAAVRIPPWLTELLEIAVAAVLIALGVRALRRASGARSRTARDEPAAGDARRLAPAGGHAHVHVARRALALRPLLVGAVHGLAGSGALVALATAALPTAAARLAFIGLFGFGSIAAMSAISGLAGWPLARIARRPAAAR
ncbi:MAG TPA: high frequency lysogenization protein HflD, partial [Polyangia bacterium]